jgi:hypothetical protein
MQYMKIGCTELSYKLKVIVEEIIKFLIFINLIVNTSSAVN